MQTTILSTMTRGTLGIALALTLLGPAGAVAAQPSGGGGMPRVGLNGAACAYDTVSLALAAATDGDTLYVSPGLYVQPLGVAHTSVTITGASADCTVAEVNGAPGDYVLDAGGGAAVNGGLLTVGAGETVTFTTVLLRHGLATDGGLIYVSPGGRAVLAHARLEDGTATDQGGLIYVAAGGSLAVNGTTFLEDGSAGSAGGALYVEGSADLNGTTVRESQAPFGAGAALADAGSLTLSFSHIGDGLDPNTAAEGGGVYLLDQSALTVGGGSTVRWNHAVGGHGGGIYASGGVTVSLSSSARVYGNEAVGDGGGIYAINGATVTLDGPVKLGDANPDWGNTAARGGGLFADGAAAVVLDDGATVMHNQADDGGGLYLTGGAPLTATASLISANTASGWGGGVVLNDASALVSATVIAENEALIGGGAGLTGSDTDFITINSQIISNTATSNGGGVHTDHAGVAVIAMGGLARLAGNQAGQDGGGVYATGDLAVVMGTGQPFSGQVFVADNTAGGSGGGLYATNQALSLLFGGLVLTGNVALADGGGVYQDAGRLILGGLAQTEPAVVQGNTALNGNGGGLYLNAVPPTGSGAGVSVGNVVISGNQADQNGGGLYAVAGTDLQLANARVQGNQAGQEGGGLYVSASTAAMGVDATSCQNTLLPPNQYCSELRNNSAPVAGGGLALSGGAEVVISQTAIISNSAALGGGVYSASNGDQLDVTDSLFSANSTTALYLAADGDLELIQSTFSGNTAAIDINDNGAVVEITNNIVWGNGAGVETAAVLDVDCSFSQNGVGGTIKDPHFQTTGRGDYRLAANSPARDACLIGTERDLDGVARPQGAQYDMGAFEAGQPLVLFAPLQALPEGAAGVTTPAGYAVSLSEAATQTVTLTVTAEDLGALAGVDYALLETEVVFAPGTLTQTVPLDVWGDSTYEADEMLALHFGAATSASLLADEATVTILNDDALPTVSLSPAEVSEGNSGSTPVTVTVSLDHASAFTITVDFITGEGTALNGEDYADQSGTLTLPPGALSAEVGLTVYGDTLVEPDEQFGAFLTEPSGAVLAGPDEYIYVWVTITNDDAASFTLYLPQVLR